MLHNAIPCFGGLRFLLRYYFTADAVTDILASYLFCIDCCIEMSILRYKNLYVL